MTDRTTTLARTPGAVIYTRVSTGEQDKHGTSPETQLANCRKKALELSLPVVAEYYDGGVSGGFLLARPGMQSALADIKAGRADTLICANISRYSRDVEHQQIIKKAVKAAGGRLAFCDMDFDDTPEGDMAFGFMGQFAEYERKNFRRRSMDGKRKRAEDGIQTCRSRSPYGYHIPTKADVLRGTYPPELLGHYLQVEDRAALVRWMFEVYAAGTHSMNQIVRELNNRNIPTPHGGKFWRTSTMDNIFRNKVYKGEAAYGKIEYLTDESALQLPHPATGLPRITPIVMRPREEDKWISLSAPAIVEEETWDRVQEILAKNRAQQGGNPMNIRMLSGRIHCPLCGGKMAIRSLSHKQVKEGDAQTDGYYTCARNKNARSEIGKVECVSTNYAIQRIERHVSEALYSAIDCPQALDAAFQAYTLEVAAPPVSGDPRREIAAIEDAITELKQEESATVQAQIAGIQAGASPHVYAEAFGSIAARRKDLEDRRGVLHSLLRQNQPGGRKGQGAKSEERLTKETAVAQALIDAKRVLTSCQVTGEDKRSIIAPLLEKVVCQKDGADVYFRPGVFGDDTFQSVSIP